MDSTFLSKLPELVKWVEQNPLLLTVTSSGAIIWLFANLKNVWHLLVTSIKALISFEITNTYEDARAIGGNSLRLRQIEFNKLLMSSKALWERTVNLDLADVVNENMSSIIFNDPYDGRAMKVSSSMVNAYGFSIRIFLGKIVTVERSYKLDGQRITMNSNIRVYFASKKKFMKKLTNAIDANVTEVFRASSASQYVEVGMPDNGMYSMKLKRRLDSIFTNGNVHKELFNSIKDFISNRETYKKLNYPYNYCALLHGVPGSGKTSTILAIASELGRNICYVNVANLNAQSLLKALNDGTENTIFVFEDIDAVSYKNAGTREKNDDDNEDDGKLSKLFGMSLSDLLNVTDGLLASDGAICLFTTNYIDKLDPAFLRAGRMNKVVEFTNMTPDVANDMIEAYLSTRVDDLKDNIKPAELQEMILDIILGNKTLDNLREVFCRKS